MSPDLLSADKEETRMITSVQGLRDSCATTPEHEQLAFDDLAEAPVEREAGIPYNEFTGGF
jgi:hypothetical protein